MSSSSSKSRTFSYITAKSVLRHAKLCHLDLTIMQRVLGIVAGRGTPLGLSTPVAVSAGHGIAGHPQVTRARVPECVCHRRDPLDSLVLLQSLPQGVTGPSHTRLAVEEVSP